MNLVKEGFDRLPVAICFFDSNGIVRLVNHRMLSLMNFLRRDGIQTLSEISYALKFPPENICCLNSQLHIYSFPDGKIMRFEQEQITIESEIKYIQITATDVTELISQQAELKSENEKLAEANDRMRRLFDQIPEIIREEETLEMKMQVHDAIGHSILASRRALLHKSELNELKNAANLWEQSISVLYRSNQIREDLESLEIEIDRARGIGVKVLINGEISKESKFLSIFSLAIRESASNCARHAKGSELYVCFQHESGFERLIITNNGMSPKEEIREGGGLSLLRYHVKKEGGNMKIQSLPCFELLIDLPEQEGGKANECNNS